MNLPLQLVRTVRKGEKCSDGSTKSQRTFFDFVVDGRSRAEYDPKETFKAVQRLLLASPADLPGDRRCVYICSECGDLGCGAITARITTTSQGIAWQDFGYQNNYEDQLVTAGYGHVGPLVFDADQYRAVLLAGVEELQQEAQR